MPARWLFALLLALPLGGCAAPPGSYWVPNSVAVERIEYGGWDALLRAHVKDGEVDYPGLEVAPRFREFVSQLLRARFTAETTEPQRLAFRINAYNALAIKAVLDGQSPVGRWGRGDFFVFTRHRAGGEEISLLDLENERIRAHGDPRFHFAIACASRSCPRLASEAYVPERLDAQLEASARGFVNDATRNRFDADLRQAQISAIFDWYDDDFAAEAGSVQSYLARYVDDPTLAEALRGDAWEVEFLPFDWSLNGVPPRL